MYVYFHWPPNSNTHITAFHKEDTATNYVLDRISKLLISELKTNYSKSAPPKELQVLNEYISSVINDRENPIAAAITAINLYEDYNKHILGIDTVIHIIKDLRVVE
jgi:hypothetical protein